MTQRDSKQISGKAAIFPPDSRLSFPRKGNQKPAIKSDFESPGPLSIQNSCDSFGIKALGKLRMDVFETMANVYYQHKMHDEIQETPLLVIDGNSGVSESILRNFRGFRMRLSFHRLRINKKRSLIQPSIYSLLPELNSSKTDFIIHPDDAIRMKAGFVRQLFTGDVTFAFLVFGEGRIDLGEVLVEGRTMHRRMSFRSKQRYRSGSRLHKGWTTTATGMNGSWQALAGAPTRFAMPSARHGGA